MPQTFSTMTPMRRERFEKYCKQVEEDLVIPRQKFEEFAQTLPGKKHFWVAKLIQEKIHLRDLQDKKKELEQDAFDNIPLDTARRTTKKALVAASPDIVKISDEIDESILIIEYLEKVERIFSQAGYDLKNYIDTKKMEET